MHSLQHIYLCIPLSAFLSNHRLFFCFSQYIALYITSLFCDSPWKHHIFKTHYSDVIMDAMASKIHQPNDCLLNRLFRRRSKKKIKAPRHGPLCGEFTGDRWIPRTKGQWRGKCFLLMTSSHRQRRYTGPRAGSVVGAIQESPCHHPC